MPNKIVKRAVAQRLSFQPIVCASGVICLETVYRRRMVGTRGSRMPASGEVRKMILGTTHVAGRRRLLKEVVWNTQGIESVCGVQTGCCVYSFSCVLVLVLGSNVPMTSVQQCTGQRILQQAATVFDAELELPIKQHISCYNPYYSNNAVQVKSLSPLAGMNPGY